MTLPLWPADASAAAAGALGGAGADLEPVVGRIGELRERLVTAAPLIVRRPDGILAVARGGRRWTTVLDATGRRVRMRSRTIESWVRAAATDEASADTDRVVGAIGDADDGLRDALQRARVDILDLEGVHAVHVGPGGSTARAARAMRLAPDLVAFVVCQVAAYGAFVAGWAVLGDAALGDGVGRNAVAGWGALLGASAALRLVAARLEGAIGIGAGRAVRRRALTGALRLGPDAMRADGVGRLTGSVLESEVAEDVAVGGGLLALVSVAELVAAGLVLGGGVAPLALTVALVAWVLAVAVVGVVYTGARRRWTSIRLSMTDRLVELIIGHRTRLTQCPPSRWHDGEEAMLDAYDTLSRRMDRAHAVLLAVPRGWVLTAALVLVAVDGSASSFAVAIGGVLLGLDALERIALAASQLADAVVAGARVAPFVRMAAAPVRAPVGATPDPAADDVPVLDAVGLRFTHAGGREPVIDGCDIVIDARARVVLEAPSGAGKSTLAALLAGIREPDAGTLRVRGRRRDELTDVEWRRRVSLSPQLHENHLLLGSLAFNLLLGRGWPAGQDDLDEAWALCHDIGLGPLVERMPSGLAEMVGDAGWQLSLGERSLVFAARSLLQRADVVVLDESFGSLDPVTMQRALTTVIDRAPALVVIRQ